MCVGFTCLLRRVRSWKLGDIRVVPFNPVELGISRGFLKLFLCISAPGERFWSSGWSTYSPFPVSSHLDTPFGPPRIRVLLQKHGCAAKSWKNSQNSQQMYISRTRSYGYFPVYLCSRNFMTMLSPCPVNVLYQLWIYWIYLLLYKIPTTALMEEEGNNWTTSQFCARTTSYTFILFLVKCTQMGLLIWLNLSTSKMSHLLSRVCILRSELFLSWFCARLLMVFQVSVFIFNGCN